ncbi:response regulator transcription factor [Paenibacillus albicereus]|uniref:Response regulator transcription factor n=1 Tax=Paenibacillus albicereus TaxID=2726185 RepID=A0A6H2GVK1_9BACL|nr:response regulator transcription factor [Paenibacillus albicereus]QJC51425.1 response regulator transcription factor [Paenibacillus albicereus]
MSELTCNVLIVDDELLARQGIKHLLDWESEGFRIVGEASNGKEALELIERLSPHILITDIVMPVMDGEELAREVRIRHPEIRMIVLSSFSEFDYVRSTFQSGVQDYILKPKLDAQKLLAALKKMAAGIPELRGMRMGGPKQQSLRALLDKAAAGFPLGDGADGARLLQEQLPHPAFAVFGARLDADSPASGTSAAWKERLEAQLAELPEAGRFAAAAELGAGRDLVRALLNFDPADLPLLEAWLERLEASAAEAGWPVLGALAGPFDSLSGLHAAIERLPDLMERRFFHPERRFFATLPSSAGADAGAPFDASAFEAELGGQQFEAAFARLRVLAASLDGFQGMRVQELKSFIGHHLFHVIVALLRHQYPAAALDERKYAYFRDIHEARSAQEAGQTMLRFLEEAESCVAARQRPGGSQAMQKLLAYIQEHYAEPLHLADVAQHFHFSPSYLSNYFASHNKEGFSEHVNRVRIEQACRLLADTDGTIADIATRVGYADNSYFTKVFRKYMDQSPSQYRRSAQEGRDIR